MSARKKKTTVKSPDNTFNGDVIGSDTLVPSKYQNSKTPDGFQGPNIIGTIGMRDALLPDLTGAAHSILVC